MRAFRFGQDQHLLFLFFLFLAWAESFDEQGQRGSEEAFLSILPAIIDRPDDEA